MNSPVRTFPSDKAEWFRLGSSSLEDNFLDLFSWCCPCLHRQSSARRQPSVGTTSQQDNTTQRHHICRDKRSIVVHGATPSTLEPLNKRNKNRGWREGGEKWSEKPAAGALGWRGSNTLAHINHYNQMYSARISNQIVLVGKQYESHSGSMHQAHKVAPHYMSMRRRQRVTRTPGQQELKILTVSCGFQNLSAPEESPVTSQ
jgi:hypothetical protein